MIKKLRIKFLTISFISIFLVVTVIVGYINLFNYTNTMNKHDTIIERVISNNGENTPDYDLTLSRFVVVIDIIDNEAIIRNGTLNDEYSLEELVTNILLEQNEKGKYNTYKYGITSVNGNTVIILSDISRDIELTTNYLYNSLFISLGGIVLIYILLYFASNYVLKPFIKNEENQKEFITNASHELKTPITIIKANLDVLKIDNIENEWTQSIQEQIDRLELLTSNLINLSKVSECDDLIKTDFSLSDAINEEASNYDLLFKEKNITSSINFSNNISFNGNEKQMRDVIKLLFDNIVKYSTGNVNIYNNEKEIFFTNSTDLEDGNFDNIFDRFTRVSISRNQEINGYGIGLSIVKKIIENHNSNITAYVLNNTFIIQIKL